MFAVCCIVPEDGLSVDVYRDNTKKELIFMEHGFVTSKPDNYELLFMMTESRCKEMKI